MVARAHDSVTALLGPTNTGKTHHAVERMLSYQTGMIGLPLRLLAREVYDKVRARVGDPAVALITGEEKIFPKQPRFYVCTVEAMPTDIPVDFLAVDEIQLVGDPERGHVFTSRLLHARGRSETMFLGSAIARPVIERLIGKVSVHTKPRFSTLSYAGVKKISRLPRRTAVVAFSADAVYAIAELLRRHRGGAAVVMGSLSPRTRNAQAALYQSGDVDFLVATDAIGMGLNMDIAHVAFAGLVKFDGRRVRRLTPAEVGQIAGRAGRHLSDGAFGATADCPPLDEELVERVQDHRFEPFNCAWWRSESLSFSHPGALIRSLEATPKQDGLKRAPPQIDLEALKTIAADPDLKTRLRGAAATRLLWDVCQVPDFRKTTLEEHVKLLKRIFEHLSGPDGRLPTDWVAGMLSRLDRVDGDVDALSARLAHVRTWTYISHRSGWLADALHWRHAARALEDKLSDELHQRLAKRFVDRRTSALIRGLNDKRQLAAGVATDGAVTVEGHFVGRIDGLSFRLDEGARGAQGRAVASAARKALAPELRRRAALLAGDADDAFDLTPDGAVRWRGGEAGRVTSVDTQLQSTVRLLEDEMLDEGSRSAALARMRGYVDAVLARTLGPLHRIAAALKTSAPLSADARSIAYRILEAHGAIERETCARELARLGKVDRDALRQLGLRLGRWSVFAPSLLGPEATRMLRFLLTMQGHELADAPPPGLTSLPADDPRATPLFGFRAMGPRAIRYDILERLDGRIRQAMRRSGDTRGFVADAAMTSLLGCSFEDLSGVLRAMGYRPGEAIDDAPPLWRARPQRRRRRTTKPAPPADTPFAALAALDGSH